MNEECCEIHPDAKINVEAALSSDHNPLHVLMQHQRRGGRGKKGFCYEATWGVKEECKHIVKKVWREKVYRTDKWKALHVTMTWCKNQLMKWQVTHDKTVE